MDIGAHAVTHKKYKGNDAPFQNRGWFGVIVETDVLNQGVVIEILFAADFRPGGIDAQGKERKQQIDDPDAKIF